MITCYYGPGKEYTKRQILGASSLMKNLKQFVSRVAKVLSNFTKMISEFLNRMRERSEVQRDDKSGWGKRIFSMNSQVMDNKPKINRIRNNC